MLGGLEDGLESRIPVSALGRVPQTDLRLILGNYLGS